MLTPNPSGLCMCGCGETTNAVNGKHYRYRMNHDKRNPAEAPRECACGCGELTRVVRGRANAYVHNHHARGKQHSAHPEYVVNPVSGCWEWARAINQGGYGVGVIPGTKNTRLAHRLYYETYVGPIPEGLHIDHLCSNRCCVNPDHLEAVTQAENNRRSYSRRRADA